MKDLHILDQSNYENEIGMNNKFKAMADCSPVLLWMSREDSLCTFFNQTWLDFTGRTLEKEWGVGWAKSIHPEDFQLTMDKYLSSFNKREPFEIEYRLKHKSGEYRWLLDRAVPFYEEGKFKGFIGSCTDISKIKEAQKEREAHIKLLEDFNNKLDVKNKILKEFSHVVAHDLGAPLRHISFYLESLEEDAQVESYSAKVNDTIQKIKKTTAKMYQLIKDLLSLSLVGGSTVKMSRSSLNEILTDTLLLFQKELEDIHADVQIGPLPTIACDKLQIGQVFQNLIQNAIKFRSSNRRLVISIHAEEQGSFWTISFKDNGIGIESAYLDSIFKIFTQISNNNMEGTGAGLSICTRIIELHGGKIWVESDAGQGSNFYFTLPKI